jgi:hypothetical protein
VQAEVFEAPANPHADGRCLLRFWAVDYLAEVWRNGSRIGQHKGGELPFVLDVSEAIRAGGKNRLAVRVLNPTHEPIDGIVLSETPHRNKVIRNRNIHVGEPSGPCHQKIGGKLWT